MTTTGIILLVLFAFFFGAATSRSEEFQDGCFLAAVFVAVVAVTRAIVLYT